MRSIGCYKGITGRRETFVSLPMVAAARIRGSVFRLLSLVLAAASLAACAQSSVVSRQTGLAAPVRQAVSEPPRQFHAPVHAPVSVVRRRDPSTDTATASSGTSRGVASFYTEGQGQQTASGERYDPAGLTAAHPTLPFGTRLQVTNVATGRSVMVRVNDRGPFVKGRVVDVSYSAAEALGMVNAGVANVKVDVVR
jgi:rare lipoprotein A